MINQQHHTLCIQGFLEPPPPTPPLSMTLAVIHIICLWQFSVTYRHIYTLIIINFSHKEMIVKYCIYTMMYHFLCITCSFVVLHSIYIQKIMYIYIMYNGQDLHWLWHLSVAPCMVRTRAHSTNSSWLCIHESHIKTYNSYVGSTCAIA